MESSWKFHGKSQQQPSRSQKTIMETPCKMHGTFMEIVETLWESSGGKFMGISMGKASNTENLNVRRLPPFQVKKTTMKTPWNEYSWKLHGNSWKLSGKVPVESAWEFHGKASNNSAGEKTHIHGNFMEHAWNIHGKRGNCPGKFLNLAA